MKEIYQAARMELVLFSSTDVISTSGITEENTTAEWVPRENEGAPCSWWNY